MRRSTTIWVGILAVLVLSIGLLPAAETLGDGAAAAEEGSKVDKLWESTGIHGFIHGGWKNLIMVGIGLLLIYLGIAKKFEPLLLIPIGFGGLLANIPYAGIAELSQGGFLALIFDVGITSGVFPLLIFMGVGAMTDFGPLLANPKTALLGAAAQLGIFSTLIGALALSGAFEGINFSIADASAIGIIGGADGPTAIFLAGKLAPDLLGAIAVAAYSYMALVP
ncbi:MAG TPA: sodium ion-translocating decarboxylase subunit beta, partial [Candidatus Latescibacteria bacterium]|nr:sodium ion-translocating decarboxylase subunit beta [Candidatus Latescibacterota bacterium]